MSGRTYRTRGVILLLVSILGVGLATIWARSLQPVASDLQRVDSLLSLLQQMRLLWEYQFVLTRQVDGSLDWLATKDGGTDDRATVFEAVFGVAEEVTTTGGRDRRQCRAGSQWHLAVRAHQHGCCQHYARSASGCRAGLGHGCRHPALCLAESDGAADSSRRSRIHGRVSALCGAPVGTATGDPPDAQLCWQVRATTSSTTRPELHFWVNVGNSEDLRELLWRLRTSDWSQSATFCPMRESEMGVALTDADLDFPADGTINCPSMGTSNAALADRNLLGLDEVEADMTVLLGRWVVSRHQASPRRLYTYQNPEDGKPYESLVLPPEIFLHNLEEVSAYRLYPTFLHPTRTAGEIVANPHPFRVGSEVGSVERNEEVIRVQPFVSDEILPYAASLEPHQRCYEHFARKAATAGESVVKVDNVWMPALPRECNTQTMFGGTSDPLNRLGDHPDHTTNFGFADTAHRYPPQLTFAAAGMGKGKSDYAGAPTARGSIMAKWLYIRHLMGGVFLAPNIGPRRKNVNDALDFTNELAWPGMGDNCHKEDSDELGDCSYLTVAENTVVFSEAIVALAGVTTTARVPSQGPIWSQGPELALESIRPYRYELSDGKPDDRISGSGGEIRIPAGGAAGWRFIGSGLLQPAAGTAPSTQRNPQPTPGQYRTAPGQHRGAADPSGLLAGAGMMAFSPAAARCRHTRSSGFTLVEILVSVLLLSLFFLSYLEWTTARTSRARQLAALEQMEQVRRAALTFAADTQRHSFLGVESAVGAGALGRQKAIWPHDNVSGVRSYNRGMAQLLRGGVPASGFLGSVSGHPLGVRCHSRPHSCRQ